MQAQGVGWFGGGPLFELQNTNFVELFNFEADATAKLSTAPQKKGGPRDRQQHYDLCLFVFACLPPYPLMCAHGGPAVGTKRGWGPNVRQTAYQAKRGGRAGHKSCPTGAAKYPGQKQRCAPVDEVGNHKPRPHLPSPSVQLDLSIGTLSRMGMQGFPPQMNLNPQGLTA